MGLVKDDLPITAAKRVRVASDLIANTRSFLFEGIDLKLPVLGKSIRLRFEVEVADYTYDRYDVIDMMKTRLTITTINRNDLCLKLRLLEALPTTIAP